MYIVIPAYEPDIRLIRVVQDITLKLPKARIIVVNDGSGPRYDDFYDETALFGATVLKHPINKGKGAAQDCLCAYSRGGSESTSPIPDYRDG